MNVEENTEVRGLSMWKLFLELLKEIEITGNFLLRGLEKVEIEVELLALSHNFSKLAAGN